MTDLVKDYGYYSSGETFYRRQERSMGDGTDR